MDWTESERRELARIRYRGAAVRTLRAVATGLAVVLAIRAGLAQAIAAWLVAMLALEALEPEVPPNLRARAQEIDRQRARRNVR